MWRGERSSWRCTDNGGCRGITIVHRGITKVHRGITKVHRGITKVHSGAARCRRLGVVNPIHAAFIQGLGYSIHRSEGYVPSDPDPPCVSQVSQVHSRREDLAVPGPLLRSVHSSAGVHSCDGTCVRISPSAGNPDAPVSGRLADSCIIRGGSSLGKGQSSQPLSGAGNCCQLTPSQTIVYLGIRIDSLTFRASAAPSRIEKFFSIGAVCEVLESLARPPRLSVSPCSEWPALNESSSVGSKSRLGFSGRGYPGSLGSSFSG